MSSFRDQYNRKIDYLRVSITDRCNLRCIYCMPENKVKWKNHDDILRFEEALEVIVAAGSLGIRKIRITGGEPLVRRGAPEFVSMVRQKCTPDEICMTTNGILLDKFAGQLRENGLDRLNISLDTLKEERFKKLTRARASLADVFRGIESAGEAGFERVKINIVITRGVNDDEIGDFVNWAVKSGHNIRFIELMPTGSGWSDHEKSFMPATEIMAHVEKIANLEAVGNTNGVANEYKVDGSGITVGFIQAVSKPFCGDCNRLRLTADGILKPCLYSDLGTDLTPLIRGGADQETLKEKIKEVAYLKPRGHDIGSREYSFSMNQIGG
jgi:GTP 3',8-cyclase